MTSVRGRFPLTGMKMQLHNLSNTLLVTYMDYDLIVGHHVRDAGIQLKRFP